MRVAYAIGVAAHVIRADRKVSNLQALDVVDVQTLVEHAVLDRRVAFFRCHAAGPEGMPGRFDMTLGWEKSSAFLIHSTCHDCWTTYSTSRYAQCPSWNTGAGRVFLACWSSRKWRRGRTTCRAAGGPTMTLKRDVNTDNKTTYPSSSLLTVLNSSRKMVGARVRLRGGEVHVVRACVRIKPKMRVHRRDFSGVCLHPSGSLAGFYVSPDHGCHVALVVHEPGVKVGNRIRVR